MLVDHVPLESAVTTVPLVQLLLGQAMARS
jgi:hypothetical protein